MKTYFIGVEEVRGYISDLLTRLNPLPRVWCPITESGIRLASEVAKVAPQQALEDVELHPITVAGSEITIPTAEAVRGKNLLLLDSAIHSGRMMSHCVAKVLKLEPATVTTYALAVKRCTSFVPTLWGVMTDEVDRPYFLLDSIPNNRLNAGSKHPQPPVHLRTLCKEHLAAPGIRSGIASIDRVTWSDRLFQMETNPGTLTYLLEEGSKIRGFLTIHQDRDSLGWRSDPDAVTGGNPWGSGVLKET